MHHSSCVNPWWRSFYHLQHIQAHALRMTHTSVINVYIFTQHLYTRARQLHCTSCAYMKHQMLICDMHLCKSPFAKGPHTCPAPSGSCFMNNEAGFAV